MDRRLLLPLIEGKSQGSGSNGPLMLRPSESVNELEQRASEFLWPKYIYEEDATPTDRPDVESSSMSFRTLEPHLSWQRQLQKIFYGNCFGHTILLVVTLLVLVPFSSAAVEYYESTWKARATALVAFWCVGLNAVDGIPVGPCMFSGVIILATLGVITKDEAFEGLSNPVLVAVACLNMIARSLENSGVLEKIIVPMLGNPTSARMALLRLQVPVVVLAGYTHSAPLVAMMIPVVKGWSAKIHVSESVLMMPLAAASVFGGGSTLIGNGANLVAAQWLLKQKLPGEPGLGFFTLTPIAFCLAAVGTIYLVIVAPLLLSFEAPQVPVSNTANIAQRYKCIFKVLPPGPFNTVLGCSPLELGLLSIPGVTLSPESQVQAELPLCAGDELVFSTSATGFLHLRRMQGLAPLAWESITRGLGSKRSHRRHFEALVAPTASMVGKPLDLWRFSEEHRAVPLAVHRPGHPELIARTFDDFVPEAHDIFIVEAFTPGPSSSDFLLVREVPDSAPPRNFTQMDLWRQRFCLVGMVLMVTATACGYNLALAAALLTLCLLLQKAITLDEAFRFINGPLLLTIASSFALGSAFDDSGLAEALASVVLAIFQPFGNFGTIIGFYLCSMLLAQLLSNVATTLIMLPMVPALSAASGIPLDSFVEVVCYAANANFATPLGHAANLMVAPHGRYSFYHFFIVGAPLQLMLSVVTCSLVWLRI